MADEPVTISVIIPAYNASAHLRRCLSSIQDSTLQPLECIVVDDGSTDDTASVAQIFDTRILRTEGRMGPAYARNLGAAEARGSILLFLDSDVLVHTDTIGRIDTAFRETAELDAIIGSYDDKPACPDFLSQYRNLMHRYVHQEGNRHACTFWTGCGAIRRNVFLDAGGFEAGYKRPAIEDIELGYRLAAKGHTIVLDPGIEVKHCKRWTITSIVRTDVLDRGIPWALLIFQSGRMPNDLNLRWHQRASVALVLAIVLTAFTASFFDRGKFLTPLLTILLLVLGPYWTQAAFDVTGKTLRISLAATLGTFGVLAWSMQQPAFLALVLGGYTLFALREALRKRRSWFIVFGWICGGYLLVAFAGVFLQTERRPSVLVFIGLILVLIALNLPFYRFLFLRLGKLCALTAIPFHVLYFFYGGVSFLLGLLQFYRNKSVRPQISSGKI